MQAVPIQDFRAPRPVAPEHRERHESNKLAKRQRREAGRAIQDYRMIEDDDRVRVCLSGGKLYGIKGVQS